LISRNGVYNYRRRVPIELRDQPEFKGRDVFQVSLGVSVSSEGGATYLSYDNKRHRVAAAALDGRSNIETEALIVFGVQDGVFTPH